MRTSLLTIRLKKVGAKDDYLKAILEVLTGYLPDKFSTHTLPLGEHGEMTVLAGRSLSTTVRFFQEEKVFVINIDATESCKEYPQKFSNHSLAQLQKTLQKAVEQEEIERIPVLKRNNNVPIYFTSSDNRVLEYDFDKILVRKNSPYQNIKILSSPTFGNTLILDDLQNLADIDINYTRGLMRWGRNSYKDMDILILGGGDGGLLHELLKEEPKFIHMVEIDAVVLAECSKHLKGACGDTLESLTGPNYTVIVDDCFVQLKKFGKEQRKFDYIFNDLTDIPINAKDGDLERHKKEWNFVHKVLKYSRRLLKEKTGRYINHATGASNYGALCDYESVLRSHDMDFTMSTSFVPSFLEEWSYFECWPNEM